MELHNELLIDDPIDESHMRYLTFLMDNQLFGLPIAQVVQITQMQEIIQLPEQSHYVKGITNLRGQIIPVIDVRLRFGKQEADFTERTCIIITHVRGSDFGLIVDEVDEVTDIQAEQISTPPKIGADSDKVNDYITGIAQLKKGENQKDRVVLLLHAGKILGETEFTSLSQTAENWEGTGTDKI